MFPQDKHTLGPTRLTFSIHAGHKIVPGVLQLAQAGGKTLSITDQKKRYRGSVGLEFRGSPLCCVSVFKPGYPPKIPDSITWKSAGANKTIRRDGKIINAIGSNILIGALWASSSAICRRRTRIWSA